MSTENTGTETAAAEREGVTQGTEKVTQQSGDGQQQPSGKAEAQANDPFADLDGDTREWLGKRNVKTPIDGAKLAYEQSKLLGNAIRVPGPDATDEERAAYLNKLGRPETPDGYAFEVPKDLPEDLPYDGDRANAFKTKAHELGLTAAQAAGLHDWFTGNMVGDFKASADEAAKQLENRAKAEGDKLVKRWGPLDGETARANLDFANRAFELAGTPELIEELKALKLMGPNKEVLSEQLAVFAANVGSALFKEGELLRGGVDHVGNPFKDGDSFNLTAQMEVYRTNPELAYSLITAAGKKPSDVGLPNRN